MNIRKSDIVAQVRYETCVRPKTATHAVEVMLQYMSDQLIKGHDIELRGFGVFRLRNRKQRVGRNPNKPTVSVAIPAHTVVRFTANRKLTAQLPKTV